MGHGEHRKVGHCGLGNGFRLGSHCQDYGEKGCDENHGEISCGESVDEDELADLFETDAHPFEGADAHLIKIEHLDHRLHGEPLVLSRMSAHLLSELLKIY
ncbi:hypothetical protein KP509_31G026500 [Ceratopteris richardii]|uniref:Uncharacterized protein n=1 Tax=Ceratopteris richardii TaxID=49495 RepID=A0A8T2QXV0_CERRI|nr:hypothetical protein KP509_31G026500 [Ceratopteris richardii]